MIAFDTWRVGQSYGDSKIAVIGADGTGLEMIGDGGMPSWSPDGTQIAFHTYRNPQTIEVMNADGSGVESVINHWGSPRWSPRGNHIASLNPNGQILLFDLATGRERRVLPPTYNGRYHYMASIGFAISPDGHRFCFGDGDGLFVATIADDGSPPGMGWLIRRGQVRQCSWAPDGKRVVFAWTKLNSNLEQLYLLDVDSDDAPTLLAGQDTSTNNSCPDWSPDGKTIVYVQQLPAGSGDTRPPVSF
jgi:Tol biopolymer transport system component